MNLNLIYSSIYFVGTSRNFNYHFILLQNHVSKTRIVLYEMDFCVKQWGRFYLVPIKVRKLANITKFNLKQLISLDSYY